MARYNEFPVIGHLVNTAIGYALSAVASKYRELDITDPANSVYLELVLLTTQFIKLPSQFVTETLTLFQTFFLFTLFSFPSDKMVSEQIQSLFRDIVRSVTSAIRSVPSEMFNFVALVSHLLTFLNSSYDLQNRGFIYALVMTIGANIEIAAPFLIDAENLRNIVEFLAATVNNEPLEYNPELVAEKQKVVISDKFMHKNNERVKVRTFSNDVPLLTDSQRLFAEMPKQVPALYSDMKISQLMTWLCKISMPFCSAFEQGCGAIVGALLKQEVTPKIFYFVAFWMNFVAGISTKCVESMQEHGVFKMMINLAYHKFRMKQMMDYICEMYMYMIDMDRESSFLIPLLLEVDEGFYNSSIDIGLVNCLCKCSAKAPERVAEIMSKVYFEQRLANLFIALRNWHILAANNVEYIDSLKAIETSRITCFRMVDILTSITACQRVFFQSPVYMDALSQMIFEDPLRKYVMYHLGLATATLKSDEATLERLFRFYLDIFAEPGNNDIKMMILDSIANKSAVNTLPIAKVFLVTRFFDALIKFIGEIKDNQASYKLLEIFRRFSEIRGEMRRYISEADLFSKLYEMFAPFFEGEKSDDELITMLWMIVFEDDECKTIRNAAPLPLLFKLIKNKKEKLMEFLRIVSDICEKDTNSSLEVNNSELPACLIHALYDYRKMQSGDEAFEAINNLISVLFLVSIKGKDLVLYFQNLTTLPGNFRPFFTMDLCRSILSFFQTPHDAPSAIVHMGSPDSIIQTFPPCPHGHFKEFSFIIDIEFLDAYLGKEADLFYIEDGDKNSFRVFYHAKQLHFQVRLKGSVALKGVFEYHFVPRTWTKIAIQYNLQRKLQLFIHGKEHVNVQLDSPGIVIHGQLKRSHIAKGLLCNIGQIMFTNRVFDVNMVRNISQFPRNYVTGYTRQEAFEYSSEYKAVFGMIQNVLYYFNPAVSYKGNLVNMTSTGGVMKTNGFLFGYSPHAKSIMHCVGGVEALLPLFEQLDMPVTPLPNAPVVYEFDMTFMPMLLQILRAVLTDSPDNQEEFAQAGGFSCLGYLLSRVNTQHFTEHAMEALKKLLLALDYAPLIEQMVEHVFMNQQIWMYLPYKIQTLAVQALHELYSESKYVIPFGKIMLMIRVYFWEVKDDESICLLDEPKTDTVTKQVLIRDPETVRKIRRMYWNLARTVAAKSMTLSDAMTLITLCFDLQDTQLTIESLRVLISLVIQHNEQIMNALKTHFKYIAFFPLLISPDEMVRCQCIHLFFAFDCLKPEDRTKLLEPFTIDEWLTCMVSTVNVANSNTAFADIAFGHLYGLYSYSTLGSLFTPKFSILDEAGNAEFVIQYPRMLPLCMLSIANMDRESVTAVIYLTTLQRALSVDPNPVIQMPDWDHPFVMFLINRMPKPTDQPDTACELCVQILVNLYVKTNQFCNLQTYMNLWSARTKLDYSHIMRKIFIEFINRPLIADELVMETKSLYDAYRIIFDFMFLIPDSDSFYEPAFESRSARKSDLPVSYQDLNQIKYAGDQPTISYTYATRTSPDGTWVDHYLADRFLFALSRTRPLFTTRPAVTISEKQLHPLYMYSFTLGIGFQHHVHFNDFVPHLTSLTSMIPTDTRIDGTFSSCFNHFMAGLVKSAVATDEHHISRIYLLQATKEFSGLIAAQYAESLFETEDVNVFMKSVLSAHNFIARIVMKFAESEETMCDYARRMTRSVTKNLRILAKSNEKFASHFSELNVFTSTDDLSMRADRIHYQLFEFASAKKSAHSDSHKQYRALWRSLSDDRGPWCQPDRARVHHYKMDSVHSAAYTRSLFKENFSFNDHMDASLLRDNGDPETAMEKHNQHLKERKGNEFGDEAMVEMGGGEIVNKEHKAEDEVVFKVPAKLISIQDVHTGTFLISKKAIVFVSKAKYRKVMLQDIVGVRLRRYLLINSSIEIFTDQRAYFFDFKADQRPKVLLHLRNMGVRGVQLTQADVDREVRYVEKAWVEGNVSNFNYLMALNILAGRTYNDLGQYPVFPWVLSDYTSDELDLNNPGVYRDLSLPIGALGQERLSHIRERMGDDEDTHFLYGSLYSNEAVVIGYMIRVEPFTSLHIKLQSGKFDIADRLFNSIPDAWDSVHTASMDFRELIPEFYHLPEFLVNANGFDLGANVNDVILPKWAKSPSDFIIKHRAALESPFVTANLPRWIDLIFGVDSRGPRAERKLNLFSPFFFETAIQRSPERLDFIQEFCACFGQAPAQIFDREHNEKKVETKNISQKSPHLTIVHHNPGDSVVATGIRKDNRINFVNSRFEIKDTEGRRICTITNTIPLEEEHMAKLPSVVSMNTNLCIFALPYDFAFHVYDIDKGSIVRIKRVQTREITAIAVGKNFYVTASNDSTVAVWKRSIHEQHFIISKHQSPVSCIAMNEHCDMVVSCAKEGSIVTSTLKNGRYLRTIFTDYEPVKVHLSSNGRIYVSYVRGDKSYVQAFDQNLNNLGTGEFSGTISSMVVIEENDGKEWLLVMLKSRHLILKSVPDFATIWDDAHLSFDIVTMKFIPAQCEVLMGTSQGHVLIFAFK